MAGNGSGGRGIIPSVEYPFPPVGMVGAAETKTAALFYVQKFKRFLNFRI